MTEEQIEKLIELLKNYEISSTITAVTVGIFLILLIGEVIYFIWKFKKVKKMLEEYYITLTEEQKEAIKKYKEIKNL